MYLGSWLELATRCSYWHKSPEICAEGTSSTGISCHLFTDSLCVLYWLRTSKPLSVFVANRVKEIKYLEGVKFAHVTYLYR